MKELKEVLEGIYNNPKLRKTCIPLFWSQSGIGKTTIVHEFAKEKGVKCLVELLPTKTPQELSGMGMPCHETKTMTFFDYDAFISLKDGDILFLDEIMSASPIILNAFLTVLEDRVLPSGRKLADIMIVAASNPEGAYPITPQIKQRFIHYQLKYESESWKNYMATYLITDEIFTQLDLLIKNEPFSTSEKNYYTPRSIEKAINMMIEGIPTPYAVKLNSILNLQITNSSDVDFTFDNDNTVWKAGEKIKWLKLKQLQNAKIITE